MKTCTVIVKVRIGTDNEFGLDRGRVWKGVDVMKTSVTRAWATRQFNAEWARRQRDRVIRVYWTCEHDDGNPLRFNGTLVGVNGVLTRRGIFEN